MINWPLGKHGKEEEQFIWRSLLIGIHWFRWPGSLIQVTWAADKFNTRRCRCCRQAATRHQIHPLTQRLGGWLRSGLFICPDDKRVEEETETATEILTNKWIYKKYLFESFLVFIQPSARSFSGSYFTFLHHKMTNQSTHSEEGDIWVIPSTTADEVIRGISMEWKLVALKGTGNK